MLFSAFFSGMEIAFVSSNRMLAEMDREKHGISQKALDIFYQHPSNFVSTMLVGNNIALVIYGILFAQIFDQTLFAPLNDSGRVICDTLLSTVVVLFTGEFLPKTLFKSNPNSMLTFFAIPAWICYVMLYPISKFATLIAKGILRIFGVHMDKNVADKEFTKVDLDYLVQSSIDNARDSEKIGERLRVGERSSGMEVKFFQNALDFSETKVRDCMVPRTEIDAIEDTSTIEQLKQTFVESGHSKILVYHEDIDHVIGYIHSSDMFRLPQGQDNNPISTIHSQLVRKISFVPETMLAQKLMKQLMIHFHNVFMQDDTYEKRNQKKLENGEYILSARLEIEKINEQFDLDLPESDDYMTLGGLILHEYQSFPKLNEVIRIAQFEFKIIKNTATKIELVRLKVVE